VGPGEARAAAEKIRVAVRTAVVGRPQAVETILTGLIADGHMLIEDLPGLGKTLMARSFALALGLDFQRIQFTADLLPHDITGGEILDQTKGGFAFRPGPLFTNVLLADEINRAPPKTQAALLQAMNERAVTIDGRDHSLGDAFMVVATQNPIEQQGTYPLPEAQLDRFLFKIIIDYPSRDEEREIVRRHGHRSAMPRLADFDLKPVLGAEILALVRQAVGQIRLSDALVDYIVDVVRATRQHASLEVGASTRAANMLAAAARAFAALQGRDFVIPDDVKMLAPPVMRHRVILSPGAELEGIGTERVLSQILDQTAAPR
jgi:MoxR-like ATPase